MGAKNRDVDSQLSLNSSEPMNAEAGWLSRIVAAEAVGQNSANMDGLAIVYLHVQSLS